MKRKTQPILFLPVDNGVNNVAANNDPNNWTTSNLT